MAKSCPAKPLAGAVMLTAPRFAAFTSEASVSVFAPMKGAKTGVRVRFIPSKLAKLPLLEA